jgi:hypothetical protein
MKQCRPVFALLFWLVPQFASSQINIDFVKYSGELYQVAFVKSNDKGLSALPDLSGYTLTPNVPGAFGTLNNTSSPPCPLNDATHVLTVWKSSLDLLLRKTFSVPTGARNVTISVALDNDMQLWLNGVLLKTSTGGSVFSNNTCGSQDPPNFVIPVDGIVKTGNAGQNELIVHGIWKSSKNYLNLKVSGDVPYAITASILPTGSTNGVIIVPPATTGSALPVTVLVYPGLNQDITFQASQHFHIAAVTVDNAVTAFTASTTYTPATYTYSFTNVLANHSISATIAQNYYPLQVIAQTYQLLSYDPASGAIRRCRLSAWKPIRSPAITSGHGK